MKLVFSSIRHSWQSSRGHVTVDSWVTIAPAIYCYGSLSPVGWVGVKDHYTVINLLMPGLELSKMRLSRPVSIIMHISKLTTVTFSSTNFMASIIRHCSSCFFLEQKTNVNCKSQANVTIFFLPICDDVRHVSSYAALTLRWPNAKVVLTLRGPRKNGRFVYIYALFPIRIEILIHIEYINVDRYQFIVSDYVLVCTDICVNF